MTPPKKRTPPKAWTWDGNSCWISGRHIHIGLHDWGDSCRLKEFIRGRLTWHLPDDVRREALAAAQAILGDHRPLRPAVLRGDQYALVPEARLARMRHARAERARAAETARLAKPIERTELPDLQCSICSGIFDQYRHNRQEEHTDESVTEDLSRSRLGHVRHSVETMLARGEIPEWIKGEMKSDEAS
jgi:hypothetical protein